MKTAGSKPYRPTQLLRHGWAAFRFDPGLRLVRYAVIGAAISVGYTLNVIFFVEVVKWKQPALVSAVCFVIWTPISYWAHRDFTFMFSSPRLSSAAKFTLTFLGRLAASAYTVYVATVVLGMHYLVGVLANWVVLPLISYLILKLWVFRANSPEAETSPS
jgi:putative flippase GtrA